MKKYVMSLILVSAFAVVTGYGVRKLCYRFPTEAEMRHYHEVHSPSSVDSISSKVQGERIIFKVQHSNGSGFKERYKVEAGRRWVMPWNEYDWKNE